MVDNNIAKGKRLLDADKVFDALIFIATTLIFLVVLYPLIYVVSASLSSGSAVTSGRVFLLPVGFNTEAYKTVINYPGILNGYKNSLIYVVVGTCCNLFMTVLAAYPLSRKDLPGRGIVMFLFTFTMLFSGGLIPTFLTVRNLGLYNTFWAMIIPGCMSVYNVIVTRTFFQSSIPEELLEASQLDGCNNRTFLVRIVLPLSGSILAVNCLFYAVGIWNNYFNAMVYLQNSELYPLQTYLREILVQNSVDTGNLVGFDLQTIQKRQEMRNLMKFALIVVATVPLLIIYPFVQKHFVKGVMLGSIKG